MLLQKRSLDKITFAGLWSNTCCSHPLYNEYEMDEANGVARAAARKLKNEMGINLTDLAQFHTMARFIYEYKSDGGWWEHEIDYALVIPNFAGTCTPNPEEVSKARWVSQEELEGMMNDRYKFTPWFRAIYNGNWVNSWWNNLEKLEPYKNLKPIHPIN